MPAGRAGVSEAKARDETEGSAFLSGAALDLSLSLVGHQTSPPLVPTTMSSLSSEVWWKILAHAISLESTLAIVKPSVECLYPFFPGSFSGFSDKRFYSSQLAIWKRSNMVAYNLMQVNCLWRGISEQFLYSAFYLDEEWRAQKFIDTIKLNPNLAKRLRTLVVIPRLCTRGVEEVYFDPLVIQVLSLCPGIDAIVIKWNVSSSLLPLFQSLDSSRRLLLLSALDLQNTEFPTFMINSKHYESLQVLELSVKSVKSHALPPVPEHITFPSLHALILGSLDNLAINVVGKWELPSLKELSISRWYPGISTALLPLIQRSYDTLELFTACIDLLHDRDFHGIIRAPPLRLRNLTFNFATTTNLSPPIHPAIKTLLCHVVTLGMSHLSMLRLWDEYAWVNFFSDSRYTPRLRSVLTDMTTNLLVQSVENPRSLFPVLQRKIKDRDVAFKGLANDNTSFVPIELLQRDVFNIYAHGAKMAFMRIKNSEYLELPVSNDSL